MSQSRSIIHLSKKHFTLLAYALLILPILVILQACSGQRDFTTQTIFSDFVKDSFELYIDLPPGYKKGKAYSIALYMDANLKMGKEIREQIKLPVNQQNLNNVIFVGVGHIGNYRVLRRRDFIPPLVKGGDTTINTDKDFGHADIFYSFLSKELMPLLEEKFNTNQRYTIIGHSFSGLFSFYCLLHQPGMFTNYVALSPSLWANYRNYFEQEQLFYQQNKKAAGYLYHSCGTMEWINKVLYSSRDMRDSIKSRNYTGLQYIYQEHQGKNHNGVVPVSLEYVLANLSF